MNRKGKPFTTAWINSKFRRISKRVGFKLTAYYFRHTWITNALLNDVSPQKVAALAGRSDEMTMRIYNHTPSCTAAVGRRLATGHGASDVSKDRRCRMILLTLAIFGLFCLAYVARPGRRAGGWLLLATILLPFALLGAAYFDGMREVERINAESLESTFDGLKMGRRT